MRVQKLVLSAFALTLASGYLLTTHHPPARAAEPPAKSAPVELELLTWSELHKAIHEEGKTTALIFNGGTEQRGPQAVTGGHTFVARELGKKVAEQLGNAIVAPVLPYSVENGSSSDSLPGTLGVSEAVYTAINEAIAEQLIATGFKNVVLLSDDGGGQKPLADLATKLDAKYSSKGVHVVHAGDFYRKAGQDFNKWLTEKGLPVGSHASIKDTSQLLYLEGNRHWIRKDQLPTAIGVRGFAVGPDGKADPAKPVRNGISGDARRSSPEIGKVIADLKVDNAVAQIRSLLGPNNAQK